MVRLAETGDADFLFNLTQEFNDRYYPVALNQTKTMHAIDFFIHDPTAVCLVSNRGYIAGIIEPDPFRDWTFLCERGWYAEDRSGIKLLNAFIDWGRDNPSINEVRMCNLQSNPGVQRLLARRGFTAMEVSSGLLV